MSAIRPGKYLTFLPYGKKTVKDAISIAKTNDLNWNITRLRQKVDSGLFKNIIKYESTGLSLEYLDKENPHYGGKVKASVTEYNISQFSLFNYNLHGYFNNSKLVLGNFGRSSLFSEETLFEVTKENIEETSLISRFTYELDSNGFIFYKAEVNPLRENESHDYVQNSTTELVPKGSLSLKETFWHRLP